jgi:hypothetical protein
MGLPGSQEDPAPRNMALMMGYVEGQSETAVVLSRLRGAQQPEIEVRVCLEPENYCLCFRQSHVSHWDQGK